MSKNEKVALWVSAAIGIIVLIWLMIVRRSTIEQGPTSNGPNQIDLAYPTQTPWTASANGLPTIPYDPNSSGCNSCSKNNGIFNSLGGLLNYYMSKSKDIFNNYQQQVYAAYPDSVTQYFNNPVGASQSSQFQMVAKAY